MFREAWLQLCTILTRAGEVQTGLEKNPQYPRAICAHGEWSAHDSILGAGSPRARHYPTFYWRLAL